MKKTFLFMFFAIFGFIANAQINMSTELSLDTPLGSNITAFPNSTTFPGHYELKLGVRAMIHSGQSGQFSFTCQRRVFGTTIWGTFSPNISPFPNSGITSIYNQSAKTYQAEGTIYEYQVKVTFVAQNGGGSVTKYTPIRKATINGVPTACFTMYNIKSTHDEPSGFGPIPVHTICQNAVTINGSCSKFEQGYHIRISEFNLATWTATTDLYNDWIPGSTEAPSYISINAIAASNNKYLVPGKLYLVNLSVGPIWHSAVAQFFRVDGTCRQSENGNNISNELVLEEVIQNLKLYPNPTKDNVTLNIEKGDKLLSYSIFDNSGLLVKKGEFATKLNEETINLSDLRKGIYLISVETEKTSFREKIIKE